MTPIVATRDLKRVFPAGNAFFAAIDGVTFEMGAGEFVAIMGASGSGKSTFMNLVGCLDRATSGTYLLDGIDVATLDSNQRADVRRTKLGFVFQQYNLLGRTSAVENVELPMVYAGVNARERRARASRALVAVGLDEGHHRSMPSELSGGQQQRVAIARALVNEPRLLLADEPTGALDSKTSSDLMTLFTSLNRDMAITILMVTHELDVARFAKRIVTFRDGRILSDEPVDKKLAVVK